MCWSKKNEKCHENNVPHLKISDSISSIHSHSKSPSGLTIPVKKFTTEKAMDISALLREFSQIKEANTTNKEIQTTVIPHVIDEKSQRSTNVKEHIAYRPDSQRSSRRSSEKSIKASVLTFNLNGIRNLNSQCSTPRSSIQTEYARTSVKTSRNEISAGNYTDRSINERSNAPSNVSCKYGSIDSNKLVLNYHTPIKKTKQFTYLEDSSYEKLASYKSEIRSHQNVSKLEDLNIKNALKYEPLNGESTKSRIENTKFQMEKHNINTETSKLQTKKPIVNVERFDKVIYNKRSDDNTLIFELGNFCEPFIEQSSECGIILYDAIHGNIRFQGDIKHYLSEANHKITFTSKNTYIPFVYLFIALPKSLHYIRLSLHRNNFLYILNNLMVELKSASMEIKSLLKFLRELYLNDDLRRIQSCVLDSTKESNYVIQSFDKYEKCVCDMNVDVSFYITIYDGESIAFTAATREMIHDYLFYNELETNIPYFCRHVVNVLNSKFYNLKFKHKFVKCAKEIKNNMFCIIFYPSSYFVKTFNCIVSEADSIDALVNGDKSKFVHNLLETDKDLFIHMNYDTNLVLYTEAHFIYDMVNKFRVNKVSSIKEDIDYLITLKDGNIYYIDVNEDKIDILSQILSNAENNRYLRILKDKYLENNLFESGILNNIQNIYRTTGYHICSTSRAGKCINYAVFVVNNLRDSDIVNVVKTNKLILDISISEMKKVPVITNDALRGWIYGKLPTIFHA